MSRAHEWTSAAFRAALLARVRRRVPDADAEDVVQSVLAEALSSPARPDEPDAARRWIWGIARHKIADHHRRAGRETNDVPERAAPPAPHEENALLAWAVGELPPGADAQKTLDWLLREGEGETLEAIAEEERLPAPVVRQRVSRLRKLFRSRWAQVVAAGLAVLVGWALLRRQGRERPVGVPPEVREDPNLVAVRERARAMREEATRAAARSDWARCLERLDAAKAIDPAGDRAPGVEALRQQARDAIERERAPAPAPVFAPDDASVGDPFGFGGLGTMGSGDSMSGDPGPPRRRRVRRDAGAAAPSLGSGP